MQPDDMSQKLGEHVSTLIMTEDGSIVTKWIMIAEVMNVNEEMPGLYTLSSDGLTAWQSKGLLQHALDQEQAATYLHAFKDDD